MTTTLPSSTMAICNRRLQCINLLLLCVTAFIPALAYSFGYNQAFVPSLRCSAPATRSNASLRHQSALLLPSQHLENLENNSSLSTSSLSTKNNSDDDDINNGGEKKSTLFPDIDEKNMPGLIFVSVLTLWHFWIGPALRPFILDMRQ